MSKMSKLVDCSFQEKLPLNRIKILSKLPKDEYYKIFKEDKIKDDNFQKDFTRDEYIKLIKNHCKKLVKLSKEGAEDVVENINYKYSKTLVNNGRVYPKSFSVQNCKKDIRSYLCSKNYVDLDMKSAHPTILYYLMKTYYPNEKFSYLKHYVKHTKKVRDEIPNAKELILTSMNWNKSINTNHKFLINLDIEFKKAQDLLVSQENEFTKDIIHYKELKKQNKKGKFLNVVCCCFEKMVLEECVNKIIEKYGNNSVSTLIHDGFHLSKNVNLDEALELLNQTTKKYGIKWLHKEFNNILDYLDDEGIELEDDDQPDYATVKEQFEKKHFMIQDPLLFGKEYIYKDKPTHSLYNKQDFKTLTEDIKFYKIEFHEKGSRIKEMNFFNEWIKDPKKRIYKKIDFIPTLENQTEFYNTFTGFDCEVIKNDEFVYNDKAVKDFVNHISFLTDFHKEGTNYLVSYLADIIQNPDVAPETAILFKSKQGYGKDKLFDIMEKILGFQYFCRTENIEDVLGQFNTPIKDKIICCINELEGKDGWDYRDKLKGLITKSNIIINEKKIKHYTQKNCLRIFIMSNRTNPIEIASDDRRFVVFKANYKKPNTEYFENLVNNIEKNKNAIYSIYKYLKEFEIKINLRTERPITKAYDTMKKDNVNPVYNFLNEIIVKNNIDEYFEKQCNEYKIHKKTGDIYILSKCFFDAYKHNYLENNQMSHLKPTYKQVKQSLNEIDLEKEKKKIGGTTNEYWIINKEDIANKLKDMNITDIVEEMEEDEFE